MRSRAGAVRISLAANDEMGYSCRPLFTAQLIHDGIVFLNSAVYKLMAIGP